MNISIALCEDEQPQRSVFEQTIHSWFRHRSVKCQYQLHSYSDAQGLLNQLDERSIFHDLFILDIGLADTIDGFDLARRVRQVHSTAEFIFISINDRAYQQAVALRALDYLIKPPKQGEIERYLEYIVARKAIHCEEAITIRDRTLSSQGFKGMFPISNIAYLLRKKAPNYTTKHVCINGDLHLCVNTTLAEFASLNSTCFARPNNECVLNMLYIKKVLASDVLMHDSTLFEITAPYQKDFRQSVCCFKARHPRFAPEIES